MIYSAPKPRIGPSLVQLVIVTTGLVVTGMVLAYAFTGWTTPAGSNALWYSRVLLFGIGAKMLWDCPTWFAEALADLDKARFWARWASFRT